MLDNLPRDSPIIMGPYISRNAHLFSSYTFVEKRQYPGDIVIIYHQMYMYCDIMLHYVYIYLGRDVSPYSSHNRSIIYSPRDN